MMKPGWNDGAAVLVRMLRIWCASRSQGENPRPHMQAQVALIRPSPEFVPACDSLFILTEAVLGRPLATERRCTDRLSRDEAAVLAMLRHAPLSGSVRTGPAVPHGLPDALRWAAFAVLRALEDRFEINAELAAPANIPGRCPFDDTGPRRRT